MYHCMIKRKSKPAEKEHSPADVRTQACEYGPGRPGRTEINTE